MSVRKIDPLLAKQMYESGTKMADIAKKFNATKAAVSMAISKLNGQITKRLPPQAPRYLANKDRDMAKLDELCDRLEFYLNKVEAGLKDKAAVSGDDIEPLLKTIAEMRKTVIARKDIQVKVAKALTWAEFIGLVKGVIIEECCESCKRKAVEKLGAFVSSGSGTGITSTD